MPEVPYDYTQLEYITISKDAYIDTDLKMGTDITVGQGRLYVDASLLDISSGEKIIAGGSNFWVGKDNNWCIGYGANANDVCTSAAPSSNRCIYDLDLVRQRYTVYDTENENYLLNISIAPGTNTNNSHKISIGGYNGTTSASNVKIYRVSIYNSGVLVFDGVPARRNSDGKLGLYDLVTETFKTQGNNRGTLTADPDVGGLGCEDVGVGYYAPASTVNYGSVGTRTACPAGTSATNGTSASDCTVCTGATYSTGGTACLSCPTRYDYNTTSGKTDITECQIHCDAGTYVANVPEVPYGYTQLSYVETSGTQYINTGIQSNGIGLKSDVEVELTAKSGEQSVIGRNTSDGFEVYFSSTGDGIGTYRAGGGQVAYLSIYYTTNVVYRIQSEMTSNSIFQDVNGSQAYYNGTMANYSNADILLFRHNTGYPLYAKIYYVTIWQNGDLVRNFVPARRNSDNEIGMYDTVTEQFFTNSGTGSFIAGSDVGVCSDVGVGYYAPASTTNYGSTGTRTACPAGTSATNGTSASDCTVCTGATYSTGGTACLSCPTRYDYNTAAGKTDITECQIHCDAGTWNGEYTQLEYIGTNHNAYIISDLTVNDFDRVIARGTLYDVDTETSGRQYPHLFGASASTSSGADNSKLFRFKDGSSMLAAYNNTWSSSWVNPVRSTFPLNTPTDIDVKLANGEQYIKINGNTIASDTLSATLNNPNNVTIFAMNYGGQIKYIPHFDCERITFYLGNDIVHNFVPARRNSDNELGMYDTVTERFFTNSGTGSFTAGSDAGIIGDCTDVGIGYYAGASTVNYGSAGTRNACPAGTFTVGYGHGADEANDCGRILHLGDSVIYTRKNKPTTPALNIRMDNGDMYYIGLSTTDHTVSRLHFQTGETKYTAFDDSLYYGERDYDTGEKITE